MIKIEKSDCHGCHACKNICPVNSISMEIDSEGFWYPKVDESTCIECGLCIKSCSVLTPIYTNTTRTAYAAINNNLEVRLESSSGGLFTALAEEVINKNGVVFGATLDEENTVKHIFVTKKSDLKKLRGSKYVQSEIGLCYKACKEYLNSGVQVLFSGTPCQIAGLKSFLLREYDNLITVDIICHGVPSPKVWNIYKELISAGQSLSDISFRDKSNSWEKFSFRYSKSHVSYVEPISTNLFMRAFLNDLCLRPSCYNCKSKTLNRHSDFTIADFWGINDVLPEFNDQKGTSLVITHNEKSDMLLKSLSNILIQTINLDEAIIHNSAAIKSVTLPEKRTMFLSDLSPENFEKKLSLALRKNIIKRLANLFLEYLIRIKTILISIKP